MVNSIGATIAGVGTLPNEFSGIFVTSTITVIPPPGPDIYRCSPTGCTGKETAHRACKAYGVFSNSCSQTASCSGHKKYAAECRFTVFANPIHYFLEYFRNPLFTWFQLFVENKVGCIFSSCADHQESQTGICDTFFDSVDDFKRIRYIRSTPAVSRIGYLKISAGVERRPRTRIPEDSMPK